LDCRYEFGLNHEEWIASVKPKLGPDASQQVRTTMDSTPDDIKLLYKVKAEMRVAVQSLLKVSSRLTV